MKVVSLKNAEEQDGEPIDEYLDEVNAGKIDPFPYNRLMIHFRKQKEYDEELKIIKKAIATFKKFYTDLQKQTLKNKINSKVKDLSKLINQRTGLVDKKGIELYLPEPLPQWIKRQAGVEQKLNKKLPKKKKRHK